MAQKKAKRPGKNYRAMIVDLVRWSLSSNKRTLRLAGLALVSAVSYAVYKNFTEIWNTVVGVIK